MGALARVLADVGVDPYRGDSWDPTEPLIGFEVGGLLPLDPAYLDPAAARPVGLLVPAADSLNYLPASD